MAGYILALDQGTTSSRAIVFDAAAQVRAVAQKELTQRYPAARDGSSRIRVRSGRRRSASRPRR